MRGKKAKVLRRLAKDVAENKLTLRELIKSGKKTGVKDEKGNITWKEVLINNPKSIRGIYRKLKNAI